MALYSLRLRALSLSSSLLHQHFHCPKLISAFPSISSSPSIIPENPRTIPPFFSEFQSLRHFRSSPVSFSSRNRRFEPDDQMEITADTILFEGCDYNHWLITVNFKKEDGLSDYEKVLKYVEIAAGVFGSEQEAKKKIYACSTTTYEGFQVECSEETSEKFKENPDVVFVLPDSYIDPVNKEYGGDKYINGTIIPRPPPMMSMRRNPRQFQGQRQENRGQMPRQEASNFGPQQIHPPPQNIGPQQIYPPPQNFGPQQNYSPQQHIVPPQNHPPQQNRPTQQNFGPPHSPASQQYYGPPQNTPPQHTYGQQQNAPPQYSYGFQENAAQQNYGNRPPQHNYGPNQQNYAPGQNFASQNPGSPGGGTGSTPGPGGWDQYNYGEGDFRRGDQIYPPANSGNHAGQSYTPPQSENLHQALGRASGEEMGPSQNHPRHGEEFSEVDQRSRGGEQRNFA